MYENKFAVVTLRITQEARSASEVSRMLVEAGLHDGTQESLVVVTYDSTYHIRHIVEIARGGYHEMPVSIPAILSAVLLSGTDRFLIAHNHPSNDLSPTMIDVDLTEKVMDAANTCGLYFEDHLILGPDGKTFSMEAEGMIALSPDLARMGCANKPARRRRVA